MSFDAGSIYYTIDAKTGGLLTADKHVSNFNQRAQEGFNRTDRSANSLIGTMGKLSTVARAVSAALVSNAILSYAQGWNELEDRIQNTGATAEQTSDILEQLLITSDRNGRKIEESAELYIRLSNSMTELGYSTQNTLSYIDTLSNLMTINKTSAISAESATNALTKAQMKGKLAGIESITVFNAMPSILKTLGKQLNKTEAEVRKMAYDGKLSMSQFTEAMINAQEETAALADNMRNTVSDGINRVTNNLKKYFGELNNSTGATKMLVDSLILISHHVDILMTSVGVLAAVYAGKYITSLANATKQTVEQTVAKMRQAQAEKIAAQAALQQAQAELANVRAAQQSLSAQLQLAKTEKTRNAIRQQLKSNTIALTAAVKNETAAQARLNAAMKATSFAANGLRSAMSLLGGPAGILFLAAGALMTWSNNAEEARQKSLELGDRIDQLREKFKSLNQEQRELELSRLNVEIDNVRDSIKTQIFWVKNLKNEYEQYQRRVNGWASSMLTSQEGLNKAQNKYLEASAELKRLYKNLEKAEAARNEILSATAEKMNDLSESSGKLAKNWDDASKTEIDKRVASLSRELDVALLKSKKNSEAAFVLEGLFSALGDGANEYREDLIALASGQTQFTKLTYEQIEALNPLIAKLRALSAENDKIRSANKTGATKSYADEVKTLRNQLELAKLEAQGLTVESELLSITQKMGGKITAQQTNELKQFIQELENLKKSKSGEEFAKQEIYNKKSPLEQIDIDEQEKLKRLNEWRATGLADEKTYQDALTAITQDAVDKRNKIEDDATRAKIQSTRAILQSSADLFGGMSDMLGEFAGESSSAYKTLFAMSKGFAIADAMLNLNSAILKALNDPTATTTSAKLANMAVVASAGGRVLSTIKGLSYGGGRLRGGGVDVGKSYRVNESGKPEMFVAQGKQYMIPNQRGEVIPSNKLSSGTSGKTVINNITQNISFTGEESDVNSANETARALEQAIKNVLLQEQRPGGILDRH